MKYCSGSFFHKTLPFLCSYIQDPSTLCLHCSLLHATVRYPATCYTVGTCMYVHTVLQNELQISSAKKCFVICYAFMYRMGGTVVAQTMYSARILCGM